MGAGWNPPAGPIDHQASKLGDQTMAKQAAAEMPGEDFGGEVTGDAADPQARIAELEAALAQSQQAERDANARAKKKNLPQTVFEPVTPHGEKALAASDTAHMTVAEVMRAIDGGMLDEPMSTYLCSDGYYARR